MRGFWKSLALFQMNRASVKSRTSCRRATVDMQCAGRMGSGGDLFQMYLAGMKASTGQRDLTRQEVCNTMDHKVDNLICHKREFKSRTLCLVEALQLMYNEKSVCKTKDHGKDYPKCLKRESNPGPCSEMRLNEKSVCNTQDHGEDNLKYLKQ